MQSKDNNVCNVIVNTNVNATLNTVVEFIYFIECPVNVINAIKLVMRASASELHLF